MNKISLLDCTLRDGGYVNDWFFGSKNIKKIINHLKNAKIDMIECGFLSNKYTYNTDRSLFDTTQRFKDVLPEKNNSSLCKYLCMVNYGEFNAEDLPDCDSKAIDGIRVAFHKKDLHHAVEFCNEIAKKGYLLFMQPMVTVIYSDTELLKLIDRANEINPYAFYIVDSFGVMKRNDLLRLFYLVDNNLNQDIKIGYHSHNNLQLAFSNAQSFYDINTLRHRIIDSSVFGMGRGAGNLCTELFVHYLNSIEKERYKIEPLLEIVDDVLSKEYSKHFWGYSLPHYLSSTENCHPNYATFLNDKHTLSVRSISNILKMIDEEKRCNFDKSYVEDKYVAYQTNKIEDSATIEELKNAFDHKDIVLILPGKSIKEDVDLIEQHLKDPNKLAISINFIPNEFKCDYHFFSNEKRYETVNNTVPFKVNKFITTSSIKSKLESKHTVNYGDLVNNTELVEDNSVLMFLKLLNRLNVNKIQIAGFDGFSCNEQDNYSDPDMSFNRNVEVINALNEGIKKELKKLKKHIEIEFITPSIFNCD